MGVFKCPHCNKDLPQETKFCPYCMERIKTPVAVTVVKTKNKSKLNKLLIILIAILFLIIALLTVPFVKEWIAVNNADEPHFKESTLTTDKALNVEESTSNIESSSTTEQEGTTLKNDEEQESEATTEEPLTETTTVASIVEHKVVRSWNNANNSMGYNYGLLNYTINEKNNDITITETFTNGIDMTLSYQNMSQENPDYTLTLKNIKDLNETYKLCAISMGVATDEYDQSAFYNQIKGAGEGSKTFSYFEGSAQYFCTINIQSEVVDGETLYTCKLTSRRAY